MCSDKPGLCQKKKTLFLIAIQVFSPQNQCFLRNTRFFSVILGFAVKPMIMIDEPDLSLKTLKHSIPYQPQKQVFLCKTRFSIDIPGLASQCFKHLSFLQQNLDFTEKNWFNRANLVLHLISQVFGTKKTMFFHR